MEDELIEQIKKEGANIWVQNNPNAKDHIKKKMKKYATAYYEGSALISDLDFENLIDVLKLIDKNDLYLTTPGWGYQIEKGVKHKYGKVGTLEYYYNYEELLKKLKGQNNLIITPKLDGVNFVAYYKNGKFINCLTRGNGYEGKDISWAFKNYNIPTELKHKSFAINGEVICLGTHGNARDITATYLNNTISNNKNINLSENIKFVPFGMINVNYDYIWQLKIINEISDFKLPFEIFEVFPSKQKLLNMFKKYLNLYDVDGLVITNYDKSIQVAYKFK